MSPEAMKALIQAWFKEFWNGADAASLGKYMSKDHINHSAPPDQQRNFESMIQFMQFCHDSFTEFQVLIQDQIVEGDKIANYWKASGTHVKGEWLGVPANGKFIQNTGMDILRISNGKIVESWSVSDNLTALEQLGALPSQK